MGTTRSFTSALFRKDKQMSAKREFHLGDILSVTTGVLASPEGMSGLYEILNYITQDSLQTLALIRAADEATPYLLEQHPWLREIETDDIAGENWREKLNALVEKYGEYHVVRPMHPEDHEDVDPIEDARRLGFKGEVITLDVTNEEEPPSPYGDINWKVDDDESR